MRPRARRSRLRLESAEIMSARQSMLFEFGISAKWIELLKEVAPRVTRAAVLFNSSSPTGFDQMGAIQSVAPSLGVEISPINFRDATDIERAVAAFARGSNDGLIALPRACSR